MNFQYSSEKRWVFQNKSYLMLKKKNTGNNKVVLSTGYLV